MKHEFSGEREREFFFLNAQVSNLMKILAAGAELFHAGGQMGRQIQ